MAVPSISDLKTYIGTLINNTYWNYNFTKLVSWLTDSTADLTFQSFNINANSSMGNAKITNLGDPTSSTDAANKGYVDNTSTPMGYLYGYIISINGTTPNTDLDIAAGTCQNSTNTLVITNSLTITKRASTSWSAGSGNGMLDTGSLQASTTYYIFAIAKADGTSDILCSTSATNPLLPTGYTVFRQIGIFTTDASVHIQLVYTNSINYPKPDYTKPVSQSWGTTYTAPLDGFIYGYIHATGDAFNTFTINSVNVWTGGYGGNRVTFLIPVFKGDIYVATIASGDTTSLIFYPSIGA